ncbi:MAG: TonB-dependent receptor [Hyphomonadaceae bacterium]|nr:TonB-dependent receptor [Hyphomonadaceae bacterium]
MRDKRKSDRLACAFGLLSASIAVSAAAPALAQSENSPLPDIVVTAERRDQNLQKVSLSATVLGADALDRLGVDNVSELQQVAPSLAINTYNRSTFVNIRGVGIAQSAPTSNPGVAYYIDGVFLPHEFFIGHSFYDIDAVEVLRGPQGTLTGQNSTGGAIYVRTPRPEPGQFSAYLDQTVGDYDWYRTVGAINIPLGDQAALRFAATHDERGSFTDNIGPAQAEPGNVNLTSVRGAFRLDPPGPFEINVRGEYFYNDTFHNAIKNRSDLVTADPFTIEEDAESLFEQEGFRVSGEIRYDLGESAQLRWLSSYQNGFTFDISDGDRTATARPRPPTANVGRVSRALTENTTTSHEFNILSQGDGTFDWVLGAFYMEDDVDVVLDRDNNNTVRFVAPTSDIRTLAENTSKSVFGQFGYEFTPQWELIAGARYSEDEQIYTRRLGPPAVLGRSIAESDQVTGRVALNFTPTDDLLLYASVARGYKAGGVNLNLADGVFGPETNLVTELGVKATLADGRLRLNGDVFNSEYSDIQLASLAGTPPLPVTQNASGGRSWGVELEALAAFGGFSFNAGLAYLNAEFDGNSLLQDTIRNANVLVLDGDRLPFSPEWTANAGVQYDIAFGDGQMLTPRVQVSHVGEQLATPFAYPATTVPERTIWDARLIYEPNTFLRLEGFVTNFADEVYIASQVQNSSSADGGVIYGAPRQVGVRIRAAYN